MTVEGSHHGIVMGIILGKMNKLIDARNFDCRMDAPEGISPMEINSTRTHSQ